MPIGYTFKEPVKHKPLGSESPIENILYELFMNPSATSPIDPSAIGVGVVPAISRGALRRKLLQSLTDELTKKARDPAIYTQEEFRGLLNNLYHYGKKSIDEIIGEISKVDLKDIRSITGSPKRLSNFLGESIAQGETRGTYIPAGYRGAYAQIPAEVSKKAFPQIAVRPVLFDRIRNTFYHELGHGKQASTVTGTPLTRSVVGKETRPEIWSNVMENLQIETKLNKLERLIDTNLTAHPSEIPAEIYARLKTGDERIIREFRKLFPLTVKQVEDFIETEKMYEPIVKRPSKVFKKKSLK